MNSIFSSSPRKRATVLVAAGALVALGGTLVSATAANAVTQTPSPAYNYKTLVSTNPADRANLNPANNGQFTAVDANGKTVQWPAPTIQGDSNGDKVWAKPDANNTTNAVTPFGLFFYVPSTHNLVDVSSHVGAIAAASIVYNVPKQAFDATKVATLLEGLAPGTEYDYIVGQTPFNTDGTPGDSTVLAPNEPYYQYGYQYNGLNTTTNTYESGAIGSPINTAPVAATSTALTATANSAGGVVLTATIQDPNNANAVDTTATGAVTFHSPTLNDVTANVVNGVATTTISYPTTNYATAYSFTAAYSGNVAFAASTSGSQSVTTSAAPANQGQFSGNETVTVPAPAAGTLTLSVAFDAVNGVQFGTATPDLVAGTFSATAPLPESTVTDTRYAKGDWTLTGMSTALTSGSNTIPASDLSWAAVTLTTPTGSGAVAGPAATSLAAAQPLATFHDGGLLGQVISKANTTLSLKTPINQAAGNYAGTLTVTLL
jgi:hypothetical protein